MGRRREPRTEKQSLVASWERETSFELALFVNSCVTPAADLMDGPNASNLLWSIGNRRRSCHPWTYFLFCLGKEGQTVLVCYARPARPAIHMAETDLSLLFPFWRLRNAIGGRAPGGLLRLSWQKEVAERRFPKEAGPGSLGPCCTRWLEKIVGDRSRPGVLGVPVHDLPRVPGAQLWVNRTSSAAGDVCIFEASIFISRPLRYPWSFFDEGELKWW